VAILVAMTIIEPIVRISRNGLPKVPWPEGFPQTVLLSDIRPLVPSPAASIVSLILLGLFVPVPVDRVSVFSAPLGSRANRDARFKQSAVSGLGRRASGWGLP
jgi:hypothetical protein